MIYSSGIWDVKEGSEDDFRRTWEANVSLFPAAEHPGLVFRLLHDIEQPRRYVSLVGPWKSLQELQALRTTAEFEQAMERAGEHLDAVEVRTYELVVEVS